MKCQRCAEPMSLRILNGSFLLFDVGRFICGACINTVEPVGGVL